jgi:hypothetical protein
MRKQLRRMALAFVVLALASLPQAAPASAMTYCPGNVVVGGDTACHLTSQNGNNGTYSCDDGTNPTWDCRHFPQPD